jgi:hypothetical protein
MSKGSKQRPTDKESFDRNYELIFKKNGTTSTSNPDSVLRDDDLETMKEQHEEPTTTTQL